MSNICESYSDTKWTCGSFSFLCLTTSSAISHFLFVKDALYPGHLILNKVLFIGVFVIGMSIKETLVSVFSASWTLWALLHCFNLCDWQNHADPAVLRPLSFPACLFPLSLSVSVVLCRSQWWISVMFRAWWSADSSPRPWKRCRVVCTPACFLQSQCSTCACSTHSMYVHTPTPYPGYNKEEKKVSQVAVNNTYNSNGNL